MPQNELVSYIMQITYKIYLPSFIRLFQINNKSGS